MMIKWNCNDPHWGLLIVTFLRCQACHNFKGPLALPRNQLLDNIWLHPFKKKIKKSVINRKEISETGVDWLEGGFWTQFGDFEPPRLANSADLSVCGGSEINSLISGAEKFLISQRLFFLRMKIAHYQRREVRPDRAFIDAFKLSPKGEGQQRFWGARRGSGGRNGKDEKGTTGKIKPCECVDLPLASRRWHIVFNILEPGGGGKKKRAEMPSGLPGRVIGG